jgi:hypothetical protein
VWAPPPSLQIAQTPWTAAMRPLMLDSTSQFRAPAPPALTSTLYATDLNEVKGYGAVNSAVRTQAQKETACFLKANVINQLNTTLHGVATQHDMDIVDAARLLAAGNMVPTDAGRACFDSKYTYQFWRPITAIRNADIDGNLQTDPDTAWALLLTTPNHPEYPSQHGCRYERRDGGDRRCARDERHQRHDHGRTERRRDADDLPHVRDRAGRRQRDRRRARLRRPALPQLGRRRRKPPASRSRTGRCGGTSCPPTIRTPREGGSMNCGRSITRAAVTLVSAAALLLGIATTASAGLPPCRLW